MATAPKTTRATAKKTTQPEAPVAEAPAKKAPAAESDIFSFSNVEVPAAFRDLTETSIQRSKDAYEKFKSNAEEATSALEETIEKSRANVVEFNKKTIEAVQQNADATLAHVKDVFAVKTLSEVIELQSAFLKNQTELLQSQAKEFQDLTKRITDEATEPYKDAIKKTAETFKVS